MNVRGPLGLEGVFSSMHFVSHNSECPNIYFRVVVSVLGSVLLRNSCIFILSYNFRRHIIICPNRTFQSFRSWVTEGGQTKISQFSNYLRIVFTSFRLSFHEDIEAFNISVNNIQLM